MSRADIARHGLMYPVLVRPMAGAPSRTEPVKCDTQTELQMIVATTTADGFYLSEFVDYRSSDGNYRKYRVIMIDGRPFPYQLAIGPEWLVRYSPQLVYQNEWMQAEEERFVADFIPFDDTLIETLGAIARRIGLDYFGIDCTLLPDGNLLVFDTDAALNVHTAYAPEIFPYKRDAVPRLIEAIERLLIERTIPPPNEAGR
jgi:hypothetical protein